MRLPGAEWPEHSAAVCDQALPDELVRALASQSDALAAIGPNFWVAREAVEAGEDEARTLVERAVQLLHPLLCHLLPADWSGAEWWCQVYDVPGKGLPFHFDKDELAMATDGSLRHPLLSCVLYLNSEEECGRDEPLGATAVLEQRWVDGRSQPEPSRAATVVWPRARRLLVFDGALSHGVLDACAGGATRRALLVNWWGGDAPGGTGRPSAVAFQREYGLPALPTALKPADAAPRWLPIPRLSVRAGAHCCGEPLPLLDALAAASGGERLAEAAGAAAFTHPDTVLWQLPGGDEDDEDAPAIACLVPDDLVPDDESEA